MATPNDWERLTSEHTTDPVEIMRRRAHLPSYVLEFVQIMLNWLPKDKGIRLVVVPVKTNSEVINAAALMFGDDEFKPRLGMPALLVRQDGALLLRDPKDLDFSGEVV